LPCLLIIFWMIWMWYTVEALPSVTGAIRTEADDHPRQQAGTG
jgi:hypothetical protein